MVSCTCLVAGVLVAAAIMACSTTTGANAAMLTTTTTTLSLHTSASASSTLHQQHRRFGLLKSSFSPSRDMRQHPSSLAWTRRGTAVPISSVCSRSSSSTVLYNVPPPAESDVAAYQKYADRQQPPASFFELQQDCIRSVRLARDAGIRLMEVEFPPLPATVLEQQDVSTYQVAAANLQSALEFAKGLLQATAAAAAGNNAGKSKGEADSESGVSSSSSSSSLPPLRKIAILCPDQAETEFCIERVGGSPTPFPGVVISSLLQDDPTDDRMFKPEQVLLNLFGQRAGGIVKPVPDADMYIILTASAQELPDVESLHEQDSETPVVMYNLKLDVLRGDLGAPAFPAKEFQDRFLSRVVPVYYLRTRQYTRSSAKPPFVVNYQGCLFRAYPGKYQTLLDTGTGRYRRLTGSAVRPALGEFKKQLTDELVKQGVLDDEGETVGFLRTGYKTTTWWEEDRPDASDLWKT